MAARCYDRLNKHDQAVAMEKRATKYGFIASTFEALQRCGSLEARHNTDITLRILNQQLRLAPTCPVIYMNIAGVLLETSRPHAEALRAAETLSRLSPQYTSDWRVGRAVAAESANNMFNFNLALKYYNDAVFPIDQAPNKRDHPIPAHVLSRALVGRAATWSATGRNDKAADDITLLLNHHVPEVDFYTLRGNYHSLAKHPDKALADYKTVLQLEPSNFDVQMELFKVLRQLRRWSEALKAVNFVIEKNPADSEMYMDRGDVYSEMDDLPKAIADYSKAISIDCDERRFYSKRAAVYRKLGKIDLAKKDDQKFAELSRKR